MTPVGQMTCEDLEKELESHIKWEGSIDLSGYNRSLAVLKELKSRRLAAAW